MICHKCKHDCPDGSQFLPQLWAQFQATALDQEEDAPAGRTAAGTSNYPNQAYLDSFNAKRAARSNTALTIAAAVLVVGVGYGLVKEYGLLVIASPILALFVYNILENSRRRTITPWKALGQDGEHRCIFCGNRGIYRKGEYRTDKKYSSCSACGAFLFPGMISPRRASDSRGDDPKTGLRFCQNVTEATY